MSRRRRRADETRLTGHALADLERLHAFLAPVNRLAAARTGQALVAAPTRLLEFPRLGEAPGEFAPREARRILVGSYEILN
jgi:plasmid stabilization system protein ParE